MNETDAGTDPSASSFTSTSSTSSDSTSSDSEDSESTTSTTEDTADSSSGSSGSTGCTDGEEGCPCLDEGDPCAEGLDCVMDVCTAGFCENEEDEPNDDAPDQNVDLGTLGDGDDPQNVMSQLDGPNDVDWFTYSCTDTTFEEVDPTLIIDQTTPLRVCIFLDCAIGGNPVTGGGTSLDCPEGSTAAMAGFDVLGPAGGQLPGCCVSDGSTIDMTNYNCPDDANDSISVWMRVDMATGMACEPYSLTYNC